MRRTLYILFTLSMELLLNWVFYNNIKVPLNFSDLLLLFGVVLLTLILSAIIMVKRINLAKYWSFPKNHPYLYSFTGLMVFNIFGLKTTRLYENIGGWVFVIINTVLLLLVLIEEDDRKRRKARKESRKNSDCVFGEEFE